ncbi:hypothetical protein [Phenylobacterium sp.]|uniref:hypothetical protein n=1 Tax=Phenylobacterium sp. TaxID=1871053 RepID=UPI003925107C
MADFLDGDRDLLAACRMPGCDYTRRMSPAEAVALLGHRCTILAARRRLRCSRCGARGRDGFIDLRPDSLPRDYRPDRSGPYGPMPAFADPARRPGAHPGGREKGRRPPP